MAIAATEAFHAFARLVGPQSSVSQAAMTVWYVLASTSANNNGS